jgi:glycerol-3-phosphate dehydrogenase
MYHPPRLVLEFILSAADKGAVVENYVEALSLRRKLDRVVGVSARDRLTGETFDIRSKVVVNAAGPWSESILEKGNGLKVPDGGVYSRDTCFVIDGAPEPEIALAIQGASVDTGSLIARGARHLFVVPWRGRRLIGVWHIVYRRGASEIEISEQEIERFLREFNGSAGAFRIQRDDIRLFNAGLVPFGESDETGEQLNFGKRSHLVDSAAAHGVEGLVTLIGVRHTMARGDAVKAIDIVDKKLRRNGPVPDSSMQPLLGGEFEAFAELESRVRDGLKNSDAQAMSTELASLYGNRALELLGSATKGESLSRVGKSDILGVQIEAATKDEMAVTLGDVVFRRTPLAAAGNPGEDVLRACAERMGRQLGWSGERQRREIQAVLDRFPTPQRAGRISEAPIEALIG